MTDETQAIVPADASSIMAMIDRASRDPGTDVEKLERLLGVYLSITGRQAETDFNEAMNAAQEELRPIATDASNPQTRSKYASYPALDRVVRPIYAKHGFSLSFDTGDSPLPEHVRVLCHVAHRAGFSRDHHVDMPADGKGAKGGDVMTKTHAVGSAITYGKRYLLGMIFNLAVGEDDDGNGASPRERSGAFTKAVEIINGWTSVEQLHEWKKTQADGLKKLLSASDWSEIVDLCNRRGRALKDQVLKNEAE